MGNLFCCITNRNRRKSFLNYSNNQLIRISNLNDGANILLINSNNSRYTERYYIWYDETENITIGMLLIFLKNYLQNNNYLRINHTYFGNMRYNINASNNMLIREYINICKQNNIYNYHKGIPYIPIINDIM